MCFKCLISGVFNLLYLVFSIFYIWCFQYLISGVFNLLYLMFLTFSLFVVLKFDIWCFQSFISGVFNLFLSGVFNLLYLVFSTLFYLVFFIYKDFVFRCTLCSRNFSLRDSCIRHIRYPSRFIKDVFYTG